jgi:hypothetical protein
MTYGMISDTFIYGKRYVALLPSLPAGDFWQVGRSPAWLSARWVAG